LQHLEVLRNGLHAHGVRGGEVADSGVTVGQPRHHVAPGRVGQGGEDPRELVGHLAPFFNHLVEEDLRQPAICLSAIWVTTVTVCASPAARALSWCTMGPMGVNATFRAVCPGVWRGSAGAVGHRATRLLLAAFAMAASTLLTGCQAPDAESSPQTPA